jgi:hypothetical protein
LSLTAQEFLTILYPVRGGLTAWSPLSAVLNPIDFYLRWHLKTLVHTTQINNAAFLGRMLKTAVRELTTLQEVSNVFSGGRNVVSEVTEDILIICYDMFAFSAEAKNIESMTPA